MQNLAEIIDWPRYEELLMLVQSELRRSGYEELIAAGIVLTGGSSKVTGLIELVSKVGSVKVTELMSVEKYSHVQHIVSNIESEIEPKCDAFDALRSCFPAGTVSGAPKIRSMEIISELERTPRGPYGGALGYFDFTGNMDFAITIRSVVVSGNRASIQAGAGIVADSVPEREFLETEHKMGAMLHALAPSEERSKR